MGLSEDVTVTQLKSALGIGRDVSDPDRCRLVRERWTLERETTRRAPAHSVTTTRRRKMKGDGDEAQAKA